MNGPEKVQRETCMHCHYKELPDGCKGCLVSLVYNILDEEKARIYYREFGNVKRVFRENYNDQQARAYQHKRKYHK